MSDTEPEVPEQVDPTAEVWEREQERAEERAKEEAAEDAEG